MRNAAASAEFEHYGQLACAHGVTRTCEYLGNMYFIRSKAPRGAEDEGSLAAQATQMYQTGCERDAWYSCVLAAESAPRRSDLRTKARSLTEAACETQSSPDACVRITDERKNEGRVEEAKATAIKGCRAYLAGASKEDWDTLRKEWICETATELGASVAELSPDLDGTELAQVPSQTLEATRTHGNPQIHPPGSVVVRLKTGERISASFRLCVGKTGFVSDIYLLSSSGFPRYDRVLFEAMQKWHYSPYRVDGKVEPVCTSVQFTYHAA